MRVVGRLNKLNVYPHSITASLHAPFHDMRDAQLFGYFAEVSRRALVMLGRCARNYLKVGDFCQTRQNLVLNAVSKVGVRFYIAPSVERSHPDPLCRDNSNVVAG